MRCPFSSRILGNSSLWSGGASLLGWAVSRTTSWFWGRFGICPPSYFARRLFFFFWSSSFELTPFWTPPSFPVPHPTTNFWWSPFFYMYARSLFPASFMFFFRSACTIYAVSKLYRIAPPAFRAILMASRLFAFLFRTEDQATGFFRPIYRSFRGPAASSARNGPLQQTLAPSTRFCIFQP